MALRINTTPLLLILFVIIICLISPGIAEGSDDKVNPVYVLRKVGTNNINWRKLLGHDQVLDYDYTGPNPKHDPRKGKGGKGP